MVNRKIVKVLSYRYFFLATVLLVLAGGLLFLPISEKQRGLTPEELLSEVISPERYITTDQLAELLINQDPQFIVADIRSIKDYEMYHLPNAVHIPMDSLFSENALNYLDQDQYDVVLMSNDQFIADQAWILLNRKEYKNLHVLKGGMNNWYKTIINPQKPSENMPATAYELYAFRKAASMYFGVAYPEDIKEVVAPKPIVKTVPKKVIPKKKKKKMPIEGGC